MIPIFAVTIIAILFQIGNYSSTRKNVQLFISLYEQKQMQEQVQLILDQQDNGVMVLGSGLETDLLF